MFTCFRNIVWAVYVYKVNYTWTLLLKNILTLTLWFLIYIYFRHLDCSAYEPKYVTGAMDWWGNIYKVTDDSNDMVEWQWWWQ